jgi:hypothetical protein
MNSTRTKMGDNMKIHALNPSRNQPIPIQGRTKALERFLAKLHKLQPEMTFLTAANIRCITQSTIDILTKLGLPSESHRGAKLLHMEKGGDPSQLVRPAIVLRIECMEEWVLREFTCESRFALEPVMQGLKLTSLQKFLVLKSDISGMKARKTAE